MVRAGQGGRTAQQCERVVLTRSGQFEIPGAELVSEFAKEQHAIAAAKVEHGAAGALREVVQWIEGVSKAAQDGDVLPDIKVVDRVNAGLVRKEGN